MLVKGPTEDLFQRIQTLIERKDPKSLWDQFPRVVREKEQECEEWIRQQPVGRHWFSLDPGVIQLNHGSYGAVPKIVREVQQAWFQAIDGNPVQQMARHPEYMAYQIITLAEYVKQDPLDIVLVSNATSATISVLRSLALGSEDIVLVTSMIYHAVSRTLDYLQERHGFHIDMVEIPLPTGEEGIYQAFAKYLNQCTKKPRVCFLDHIASTTALVFPITRICRLLRDHGILSIVDGAHAIGHIPLNLEETNPDFYFSNAHKWMFAPLGAGTIGSTSLVVREKRMANHRSYECISWVCVWISITIWVSRDVGLYSFLLYGDGETSS
jgi:selenocysteine lyase/cysteine desulfurase